MLSFATCRICCWSSLNIFSTKPATNQKKNQPRIVVVGTDFTIYDCIANEKCSFDIKTDDTTICRCKDFVRAFLLIIALHYVFNVIYSSKSEVIMSFIPWMWPEINDNQKIPPKTLSLICRIKNLVLDYNAFRYTLFSDTFFGIYLQISVFV